MSRSTTSRLQFPKGFLWGSATSAHQIEGNNINNDWWEAEQKGLVPHKSGRACDSYNRYEEDFDLAKAMYNNAHRFSIEWSRIEPEEGKFDEKEIEHYKKVLQALRNRGLEPFVTLCHFTIPLWFAKKGGWASKKAPEYFERYARYVLERLGGDARYWITINEPIIFTYNAYVGGVFPPQKKSVFSAHGVIQNLVKAHQRGYKAIKEINGQTQVGIAKNNSYFGPYANQLISRPAASLARKFWNHWFLDRIQHHLDFIGIQYYFHIKIGFPFQVHLEGPVMNDLGWEIYPEGVYHVLSEIRTYNVPIYITENGVADAEDKLRKNFIKEHLKWIHKAISEGVDVKGYFHWSLLDNFEWENGFTGRFGLVEINYDTFKRTPRPSAQYYAEICKTNQLEV